MRRALVTALLMAGAALATTGAAPAEKAGDACRLRPGALTAMAYAAAGLCRILAIVWAGFVLMAEGGEERGGGRAKATVDPCGGRPGPGALGQGRRRPAQERNHPVLPNPIEIRNLTQLKKLLERITRRWNGDTAGGLPRHAGAT